MPDGLEQGGGVCYPQVASSYIREISAAESLQVGQWFSDIIVWEFGAPVKLSFDVSVRVYAG
jgi:hypothetical protein